MTVKCELCGRTMITDGTKDPRWLLIRCGQRVCEPCARKYYPHGWPETTAPKKVKTEVVP
jgi:hypothetical protein